MGNILHSKHIVYRLFALTLIFVLGIYGRGFTAMPIKERLKSSPNLETEDKSARTNTSQEGPLSSRLISNNKTIRDAALEELDKLSKESKKALVPALIQKLEDPLWERRGHATFALLRIGPLASEAIPILAKMLKSSEWYDRSRSAQTLAEIVKCYPGGCASDDDADVHLSRKAAREILPILMASLQDEDVTVRMSIANLLCGIVNSSDANLVPGLILSLSDDPIKSAISQVIGNIGPAAKEAVPHLIPLLKSDSRYSVATALGQIGPEAKEAVPLFLEALNDPGKDIRAQAVEVLGKIGPGTKEVIPALVHALEDTDLFVQLEAEVALKTMGPLAKEAVIPLIDSTRSGRIKSFSVDAIFERIGYKSLENREVISLLSAALKDTKADIRIWAASTLGKIGPAAKDAIPALQIALEDTDKSVVYQSRNALTAIGFKSAKPDTPKIP